MLVLLTASFLVRKSADLNRYFKALLILGLVSCLYGIGQHILGSYPWESDWIVEIAFAETTSGWLTVGLRGVEFRLFSVFYNYMDFTFCNTLIFALAISFGKNLTGHWKKIRMLYIVLWAAVLVLTLERTPLLMSIIAAGVVFYLNSTKAKRKRIIWKSLTAVSILLVSVSVAAPYLKNTRAEKLIRFAELANPLTAGSIKDRFHTNWSPTIETISANPLGVGIGYGSQTKASTIASKSKLLVEPHNELLQKTLEMGIFGGIVFVMLLIAVFRDSLRLSRAENTAKRLGIGFSAVTIGFWLCGMVNVPFSGSSGLLYWATAGVVLAAAERTKELPAPAKPIPETADISRS
jgi:O-antigen ligase